MNDFTKKELTIEIHICPKCGSNLGDIAAVFWDEKYTKIVEKRIACSNLCCDYILVNKYE